MSKFYFEKIFILYLLFLSVSVKAQVNQVLSASQFGGVSNVSFNPAIADNPFFIDINLVSASFGLENNYIGLKTKGFTNPNNYKDNNFQTDFLNERLNGNAKKLYVGAQVQGPLSFMVSFGKKHNHKNAIALSWHTNAIVNIEGVSQQFARIAYWGLGSKADSIQPFNYQQLNNQNFSAKALAWADFGATYSRVLLDKGPHMLKAGITGKFIIGLGGAFISSKNINYKFRNYDTLDIYNSDISYGHSDAISQNSTSNLWQNIMNNKSKVSFAADLGIVYEWRPNKDKFNYTADCQEWCRNDQNKYKLAFGFSVIDIGRVRFSRPGNVSNYSANIQGWDVKHSGINSVSTFDSVVHNTAGFTATQSGSFAIWLPTRFNLYVDYEIYKGLGLNLNGIISADMSQQMNQVHYPSTITLTPRYDMKWVGVYIPLSYNEYGNFGAGFGLRAGPLFVTSSNIISSMAGKNLYALNIQAGLKITIPYMKVKDKKRGTLGNSVTDSICPANTADLLKYFPNPKGDLVYSTTDPSKVGPGSYTVSKPNKKGGCPDTAAVTILQKAGVNAGGNKSDAICAGSTFDLTKLYPLAGYDSYKWNTTNPTSVGAGTYILSVAGSSGCTDTAIATITVKAKPNLGGNKTDSVYSGSLFDLTTLYPNIGYSTYKWSSAVGADSKAPAGTYTLIVSNSSGCSDTATASISTKTPPVLTKKEIETVKYAFDNLEFETGKDKIKQKSDVALNSLATLLVTKGYGLKIEGHTDNVGNAEFNMELSRKRAEAVKNYLMDKGVPGGRLETAGYGMTKPIADNKTAAGRQKNRRVEMTVIFK